MKKSGLECDVLVIGGGFFGLYAAHFMAQRGTRVIVTEEAPELLSRASINNQARVHNGFHYPRSVLTARRSRVNYPRFAERFASSIVRNFQHYYGIPRRQSNVSSGQFQRFMEHIGAIVESVPLAPDCGLRSAMFEGLFRVEEFAFDARQLKAQLVAELNALHVPVLTGTSFVGAACSVVEVRADFMTATGNIEIKSPRVLNATYARLNETRRRAALAPIPLKYEVTEMCLLEAPATWAGRALTVMCGPFFSLMPYPSRGLYSLSHVRYTPHVSWTEGSVVPSPDPYTVLESFPKQTNFLRMQKDCARYLPAASEFVRRDSIWEIKALLPRSDRSDSRPILFHRDTICPNFASVLGGKLDNVFDLEEFLGEFANGV